MVSERHKPIKERKNIIALPVDVQLPTKPAGQPRSCGRVFKSAEELEKFDPLFDDKVPEEADK